MYSEYMVNTTMNLLSFRKAVRCSSISLALVMLLYTFLPRSECYTMPLSFTRSNTPIQQEFFLRPIPLLMLHRRESVRNRQFGICAEETGRSVESSKKKRRRRQPIASQDAPSTQDVQGTSVTEDQGTIKDFDLTMMNEIVRYEFQNNPDAPTVTSFPNVVDDESINPLGPQQSSTSLSSSVSGAIPLPDIKEARKRKQMEEEMARIQQEQDEQKVKIKRTDKEAFRRLLEQQPFADADESYFEEEQYGVVSALLGERAKPFLSIPLGPLQVGHFIGSLVFVLMAFVEYPGFPLTNLPTPLRECFQGGLGFVYGINALLAILVAVRVAPDRGQPAPLWIMKTFTVGGLAFDQLMQLPTLLEIEKAKSVKGSRANKKKPSTR